MLYSAGPFCDVLPGQFSVDAVSQSECYGNDNDHDDDDSEFSGRSDDDTPKALKIRFLSARYMA